MLEPLDASLAPPAEVLVIGSKLMSNFEKCHASSRRVGRRPVVVGLEEAKYDVRRVQFYLSFKVILSSYRLCLLHLALERQNLTRKPYVILATGAQTHTDMLVEGGVCDEVIRDYDGGGLIDRLLTEPEPALRDLSEKARKIEGKIGRVSAPAFTAFMAYIGRGNLRHGGKWWTDWAKEGGVSEAEFYRHARELAFFFAKKLLELPDVSQRVDPSMIQRLEAAVAANASFTGDPSFYLFGQKRMPERMIGFMVDQVIEDLISARRRIERILKVLGPGFNLSLSASAGDSLYPIDNYLPRLSLDAAHAMAQRYYSIKGERNLKKYHLMIVKPHFKYRAESQQAPVDNAFMIMPFDAEMADVYSKVIKPAVEEMGFKLSRGDDFFSTGEVMEDVWRRLNESAFIIADLTRRNPNVFYELGIAHTLGKPVILLSQSIDDVPFDVRHNRVILYSTRFSEIDSFKQQLQKSIATLREEQKSSLGLVEP